MLMAHRHFDADNSAKLHLMRNGVQRLTNQLSNDMKEKDKVLESLSSSGSAMLALSRSTNDRLKDVQTNTNDIFSELKDVKELLLEVLSNTSLTLSSCSNDYRVAKPNQLQVRSLGCEKTRGQEKADKCSSKSIDRSRSTQVDSNGDELGLEDGRSDEEYHPQWARERDEPEFKMVLRASKNLANIVHRMYHPFLAVYVCVLYAWYSNKICARFMELELPTGSWAENFNRRAACRKVQRVRQRAQIRILALRKICFAEGLHKDLDAIDAEMGITETIFEDWEEEERDRQRSCQRLLLTSLDAPADRKKDRLTRVNEWLLQVWEAYRYLAQLHRDCWYSLMNERGGSRSALFPADWDRATLKYWFLDTAAMTAEDYAASSLGGGDSEATIIPFKDDCYVLEESHRDREEPLGFTQFLLLQPQYPSVLIGEKGAYPEELRSFIETPAGDLEPDSLAAAHKALADYGEEPAAGYSVERIEYEIEPL